MFKAHIKLSVLTALNEENLSGYDLMKNLGEYGKKPSPGYIYPLLNELEKTKFISLKNEGRRKIYSITAKGKKMLNDLKKNRQEMLEKMKKIWKPLADKKEIKKFTSGFKNKEIMEKFHKIVFLIHKKEKSRKKIIKIINEMIKKIEAI